jgi:hypothetical protein
MNKVYIVRVTKGRGADKEERVFGFETREDAIRYMDGMSLDGWQWQAEAIEIIPTGKINEAIPPVNIKMFE